MRRSFLFICEKKHVLFPHVEMKGAAIFKIARFRKYNVPSEFNPPLCPSFLPLIPLEEARYSSRYCPQARPGAPQAAPTADRAPCNHARALHPTRRKIIEFKPVHVNPNPISKLTWAFANRHAPDLLHAGVVQIGLAQNNAHPFLLLAQ